MDLARMIDHTLLKAEATEADIRRLVDEAVEHRFASVCVNGRCRCKARREMSRSFSRSLRVFRGIIWRRGRRCR